MSTVLLLGVNCKPAKEIVVKNDLSNQGIRDKSLFKTYPHKNPPEIAQLRTALRNWADQLTTPTSAMPFGILIGSGIIH